MLHGSLGLSLYAQAWNNCQYYHTPQTSQYHTSDYFEMLRRFAYLGILFCFKWEESRFLVTSLMCKFLLTLANFSTHHKDLLVSLSYFQVVGQFICSSKFTHSGKQDWFLVSFSVKILCCLPLLSYLTNTFRCAWFLCPYGSVFLTRRQLYVVPHTFNDFCTLPIL